MENNIAVTQRPLPMFVTGVVIADLIFCGIRALIALGAVASLLFIADSSGNTHNVWVYLDTAAQLGIAIFGIPAAITLLLKKPIGVKLGWVTVLFTVLSVIFTTIQMMLVSRTMPDSAFGGGFLIGSILGSLFRLAVLALYVIALLKATAFFRGDYDGVAYDGGVVVDPMLIPPGPGQQILAERAKAEAEANEFSDLAVNAASLTSQEAISGEGGGDENDD